jgi:kumamolisin
MTRLLLAVCSSLAAVMLVLAASAAASTGAKVLSHNAAPAPVANGTAVLKGKHAASAALTLNVGLAPRDSGRLDEVIAAASTPGSPEYGHYLTNAQYLAEYAPTGGEVAAVEAFLKGQGLEVTGTSKDNLLVYVHTSTAAAEQAFGVTINDYKTTGREFFANSSSPSVPAGLNVQAVSGLSNYDVFRAATTCSGGACGFNGADFRAAYNIFGTAGGQSIGFTLWGRTPPKAQEDYKNYATATSTTELKVGSAGENGLEFITVGGVSSINSDGEVQLDTEVAHAVAPGVHEHYWLGVDNSNATLEKVLNEAANSSDTVISNSWDCQPCALDLNMSSAMQHGASTGKTFYFSSGDGGAADGISMPADSQYDVAVGGTNLQLNGSDERVSEEAMKDGGGCTNEVARPSWQTGIGSPEVYPSGACSGRAMPDVSADSCYGGRGEGEVFYAGCRGFLWVDGSPGETGGTSMAAPIWSGMAADWNKVDAEAGEPGTGFSAPLIYTIGNNAGRYAKDFHDITTGSNPFPAHAGWDEATGWGTPKYAELVWKAPEFTTQPQNVTAIEGTKAHFTAACRGIPGPPLVEWEVNGSSAGAGNSLEWPAEVTGTKVRAKCSNAEGTAHSNEVTLTVAKPPTATITLPLNNKTYILNSKVKSTFSCTEGTNGPGIESCLDSNGGKSPGGTLNTTHTGIFTYTVTAKSLDGGTGTATIRYAVVPAKGWKAFEYCGSGTGCGFPFLVNTTTKVWEAPVFEESGTIETVVGKPTKTDFIVTSALNKGFVYTSVKTSTGYNSAAKPGNWEFEGVVHETWYALKK